VDITLLKDIELDRQNDDVYSATTSLISSVMHMTQTTTDKNAHLYVPLVKVGVVAAFWKISSRLTAYGAI